MSEFSRLISIKQSLMNDGGRVKISATKAECEALAKRYEFHCVDSISLQGQIDHYEKIKGSYIFTGTVKGAFKYNADEDFFPVSDSFELPLLWRDPEVESDTDYELIQDGAIDFGELAAQFFYLAQDTFMEDALMASVNSGQGDAMADESAAGSMSPFAILQKLAADDKDN